MRRRKFLNVGGLGLLSLNAFSSGLTSLFFSDQSGLSREFLQNLGAIQQKNDHDFLNDESTREILSSYLKIGYTPSEINTWQLGEYYFLPMKLVGNHECRDEVVFTFRKGIMWQFVGTFQASNMIWLLKNKNQLLEFLPEGKEWADIVLPLHAKRKIAEGFSFYTTGTGEIGFSQIVKKDEFLTKGTYRSHGKELFSSEISMQSMHPGQYFKESLS